MGIEVIISDENSVSIDRHETTAKLLRLEYYLNRVQKRTMQLKRSLDKHTNLTKDSETFINRGLKVLGVESWIKYKQ